MSDGTRSWVMRRPPLGHVLATAHDMGREYRVMTALRAELVDFMVSQVHPAEPVFADHLAALDNRWGLEHRPGPGRAARAGPVARVAEPVPARASTARA